MHIDLPPEIEQRLQAKADERGLPLSEYVRPSLEALANREPGRDTPEPSSPLPSPEQPPAWRRFVAASRSLPDSVVEEIPSDGARNLDHYLYGAPKRDE
jgi:hypothetical protein